MVDPTPDRGTRQELHACLLATAQDIASLLRTDADAATLIPDATWTVGQAAAHLVLANELMADLAAGTERAYGDGTAASLAAANEDSLAAWPERDLTVLADGLVRHTEAFVAADVLADSAAPVASPLGPMTQEILGSYLLTHMLGHGWDMARALRRPHMIDRRRAELCLPFLLTAMPWVLDRDAAGNLDVTYTLGLRGNPDRFAAAFSGGSVTVTPGAPQRSDCTIITESVTFLLIALGRCSPWSAVARGKILAWGRRPHLAATFPTYFRAP
ncbi:maleylpyruvate isomerase family mycothiol-dependent enzyme [Streptacidiphilus sp. MAP12-33]|uniref:maleylpyruvate isomerase family mycothiol-dependent enzyme n=1 Tax=Streptacidiphilus sp. MAP12-33 TaxID=3156266 RepID=UPI003512544D